LELALGHADLAVRREAVAVVKARNVATLDARLGELSRQAELPAELRIAALDCVASRQRQTAREDFALLTAHLSEKTEPLLRVAAAGAVGAARLDAKQLAELARHVAEAGPLTLPLLTLAFARSNDAEVGRALLEALKRSPGAEALSADDLDQLLKNYPA